MEEFTTGVIAPLVLILLALFMGYLRGVEKERNRISNAFQLERNYTSKDFDNVLEENRKRWEKIETDKRWVKFHKKNEKLKNKLKNKKNHSN